MFIVDLAVPRDVEPATAELEDVYLYTVDDLAHVIEENLESRRIAAVAAGDIVAEETERFSRVLRALDAVPVIRSMRAQAEAARDRVLAEARRMLENGRPATEVLEFLARSLTSKLMHPPSERLRRAGEDGDLPFLDAARELFGDSAPDDREPE